MAAWSLIDSTKFRLIVGMAEEFIEGLLDSDRWVRAAGKAK
jgi:hypothetical protein